MPRRIPARGQVTSEASPDSRARRHNLRVEPLERRTLLTTLAGTVFLDGNANGQWDPGSEAGQIGINVYLDQNGNGWRDQGEVSTVTNLQGGYSFDVSPGNTYQVGLDLATQWMQTMPGLLPRDRDCWGTSSRRPMCPRPIPWASRRMERICGALS